MSISISAQLSFTLLVVLLTCVCMCVCVHVCMYVSKLITLQNAQALTFDLIRAGRPVTCTCITTLKMREIPFQHPIHTTQCECNAPCACFAQDKRRHTSETQKARLNKKKNRERERKCVLYTIYLGCDFKIAGESEVLEVRGQLQPVVHGHHVCGQPLKRLLLSTSTSSHLPLMRMRM